MDDLAGKLTELLNDPQTMEKIKGLSGLLGQSSSEAAQPSHPAAPQQPAVSDTSAFPADMMQTMMKLAPLFSTLKQEDDSTRLLHALRPLLGEKRQKRLDESVRMMQMMRILPLLKSSGILSNLF